MLCAAYTITINNFTCYGKAQNYSNDIEYRSSTKLPRTRTTPKAKHYIRSTSIEWCNSLVSAQPASAYLPAGFGANCRVQTPQCQWWMTPSAAETGERAPNGTEIPQVHACSRLINFDAFPVCSSSRLAPCCHFTFPWSAVLVCVCVCLYSEYSRSKRYHALPKSVPHL